MDEIVVDQFCQHVHEHRGAEILDGYLLLPSHLGGGILIMACAEKDYPATKQEAMNLLARHGDRISSVYVYYVGDGSFFDDLPIQGKPYYGNNLCWVWHDDYELLLDHDELGHYIRRQSSFRLSTRLGNLPRGQGKAFEDLLADILRFTLPFAIQQLEPSVEAFGGARERDMKISLQPGCALQGHFQRAGLPSNNLLVEAKNQQVDIGDDVLQVRGYLGERKFASIGFLVTRSLLGFEIQRRVMDANREGEQGSRILVIPLNDMHLQEMIAKAGYGEFVNNEHFLIAQAEDKLNAVY